MLHFKETAKQFSRPVFSCVLTRGYESCSSFVPSPMFGTASLLHSSYFSCYIVAFIVLIHVFLIAVLCLFALPVIFGAVRKSLPSCKSCFGFLLKADI